jgi:hypothetical protein
MQTITPHKTSWRSFRLTYAQTFRCAIAAGWAFLLVCQLGGTPAHGEGEPAEDEVFPYRIGATATITEVSSGLPFDARVDTGATSCSIHCEALEIDDPSDDPKENVGKPVRFQIKNNDGQTQWIEAKIAGHVVVKTSEKKDERYKVQLNFRWQDVEKKVLVTLNDRQHMNYPLLLGRNFLRDDFLVDVTLDQTD